MKHSIELTVRPARASEAAGMAAMSRDLIESGLAWRYRPEQMSAMVRDPNTIVVVACNASADLCGFAAMHFAQETAHLTLLCVQPAQQRQGVATRLLEWLLQSAQVAGISSVGLELRADNATALAFYRRLQFEQTQTIDGYYGAGLAAHRMVRTIRPPDAA